MHIEIKLNDKGKYSVIINKEVLFDNYSSSSKACEKASKYLKGQNK